MCLDLLKFLSLLTCLYGSLSVPQSPASPNFRDGVNISQVGAHDIGETSGICASRIHANILYVHNDKGDGPNIYAISALTGHVKTTLHLHGAHNYDWEDIACGPCDVHGGHCIYIGDIGDHSGKGARNIIYKIREPESLDGHNTPINAEASLQFTWNPPQQDAETLMVDPSGNVYVISKVHNGHGQVGVIPNTAWLSHITIPVIVDNLVPLRIVSHEDDPRGGDISPNGKDILVQTSDQIFFWHVVDGQTITDALSQSPIAVPFHFAKHSEAVGWDALGRGYYTLSEGHHETLYYYARN